MDNHIFSGEKNFKSSNVFYFLLEIFFIYWAVKIRVKCEIWTTGGFIVIYTSLQIVKFQILRIYENCMFFSKKYEKIKCIPLLKPSNNNICWQNTQFHLTNWNLDVLIMCYYANSTGYGGT